jgi:predicted nucleotidyltransferase
MLIDIFIKSPEQKVLSLFAMNPDLASYGRAISKKLRLSLGAVHGVLNDLEKRGILDSQRIGKTKLYRSGTSHPIIRSFRILNTLLILEPLIKGLRDISRRVILFGSYATGSFASSSDLDLFIVTGEKEKILRKIESFQRKNGLDIRPIIKDQVEWMELEEKNPELFDELGRGIALWEKPVDESGF